MKEISNEKIFDLLAEKSFDQLDSNEQEIVLQELSKADYEAYYTTLHEFKAIDNNFESEETPKLKIEQQTSSWWQYKIPTYQVAASIALAVALTYAITQKTITYEFVSKSDSKPTLQNSISLEEEVYPENFVIDMN